MSFDVYDVMCVMLLLCVEYVSCILMCIHRCLLVLCLFVCGLPSFPAGSCCSASSGLKRPSGSHAMVPVRKSLREGDGGGRCSLLPERVIQYQHSGQSLRKKIRRLERMSKSRSPTFVTSPFSLSRSPGTCSPPSGASSAGPSPRACGSSPACSAPGGGCRRCRRTS